MAVFYLYTVGDDDNIRKWSEAGAAEWAHPLANAFDANGVAVGPTGSVYAVQDGGWLTKVNQTPAQVWSTRPTTSNAYGVKVSADGTKVYYNARDGLLREFIDNGGSVSAGWTYNHGFVNLLNQIAIDSNDNLYVAYGNQILKINSAGSLVWSRTHSTLTSLGVPAVDASGNVFVSASDGTNRYVARWDSSGTELSSWALTTTGVNADGNHTAVDTAGNVIVSTGTDDALAKFQPNGTKDWENSVGYWPWRIGIRSTDDYIFTLEYSSVDPRIRRYTAGGAFDNLNFSVGSTYARDMVVERIDNVAQPTLEHPAAGDFIWQNDVVLLQASVVYQGTATNATVEFFVNDVSIGNGVYNGTSGFWELEHTPSSIGPLTYRVDAIPQAGTGETGTDSAAVEIIRSGSPDVIIERTNYTGAIGNIREDPDAPDVSWITQDAVAADAILRASFPTPQSGLDQTASAQSFRAWVRKSAANASNPVVDVVLYESGSPVRTLATNVAILATSGEMLGPYTWSATELIDTTGAGVEIRLVATPVTSVGGGVTRLAPDAILVSTGYTGGTVADIDDDPDSPDANWLTAPTNTATVLRVSFPSPPGNLATGAGLQQVKFWLRKNQTTDPTATFEVYESGVLRATLASGVAVTSQTGQLFTYTWDASILAAVSGANVELRVTGTTGGGNPNSRGSVEVGAIEWNADVASYTQYDSGIDLGAVEWVAAQDVSAPAVELDGTATVVATATAEMDPPPAVLSGTLTASAVVLAANLTAGGMLRIDFSNYPVGVFPPSGWTDMGPNHADFVVASANVDTQAVNPIANSTKQLSAYGKEHFGGQFLRLDEIPSHTYIEVAAVGRLNITSSTEGLIGAVGVVVRGSDPGVVGYPTEGYVVGIDADGDCKVYEMTGGSLTQIASAPIPTAWTSLADWAIRVQFDGTNYKVRVWRYDNEAEPGTWLLEFSDSTHSSGDMAGLYHNIVYNSATAGISYSGFAYSVNSGVSAPLGTDYHHGDVTWEPLEATGINAAIDLLSVDNDLALLYDVALYAIGRLVTAQGAQTDDVVLFRRDGSTWTQVDIAVDVPHEQAETVEAHPTQRLAVFGYDAGLVTAFRRDGDTLTRNDLTLDDGFDPGIGTRDFTFSRDGKMLALFGADADTVRIYRTNWRSDTLRHVQTVTPTAGELGSTVTGFDFSPDRTYLAISGGDNAGSPNIAIYQLSGGTYSFLESLTILGGNRMTGLVFNPVYNEFVVSGQSGEGIAILRESAGSFSVVWNNPYSAHNWPHRGYATFSPDGLHFRSREGNDDSAQILALERVAGTWEYRLQPKAITGEIGNLSMQTLSFPKSGSRSDVFLAYDYYQKAFLYYQPATFTVEPVVYLEAFAEATTTATGDVTIVLHGTAAATLPALSGSAAGTVTPPEYQATAAIALPAITASSAATVAPPTYSGTGAATLPALTASAIADYAPPTFDAIGDATLPAITAASVGTVTPPEYTATTAAILPALTVEAQGTAAVVFEGTAALSLPALTATAAGTVAPPTFAGSSASTLPALTASAAATYAAPTFDGTAAITLPAITVASAGTVATATFDGSAAFTLPALTSSAAATAAPPTFDATASLALPAISSTASGTVAAPTYSGTASATLPALSASAAGTFTEDPFEGTASGTLPSLTVAATATITPPAYSGAASVALPALTIAAAGEHTVGRTGTASVSLPALTATSTATVAVPQYEATGTPTLPALTTSAAGTMEAPTYSGSGAATLPALQASATATAAPYEANATTSLTLPAFEVTATGTVEAPEYTATAAATLPMLGISAAGEKGIVRPHTVAPEDRLSAIGSDERVTGIGSDNRSYRVAADNRKTGA